MAMGSAFFQLGLPITKIEKELLVYQHFNIKKRAGCEFSCPVGK